MKKVLLSALLATTVSLSSLEAFDDKREGFILGVGIGATSVKTDVKSGRFGAAEDESAFGIASSFKIGYGFTDQFSLYYMRNASWFGYDEDRDDDTYASGIAGIGANYYIGENSPMYVMAGIGFGDLMNVTDSAGETGSSFVLGGGYEVYEHVQVEASYLVVDIDKSGGELGTNAIQLTVNYLWY